MPFPSPATLHDPLSSDSPEHLAGVISLNSERSIKLIIKKLYTNWARALTMDPNLVESLPKDSHNRHPTVFTPLFCYFTSCRTLLLPNWYAKKGFSEQIKYLLAISKVIFYRLYIVMKF